ncbi:MAG: Heptaprenyl diphosphate synthase component 2 [Pelotomaculum sp. PtaB.Bin104]|nr:MAG: Heptaprenyl diphosphate synthase component 2 [Pelotomaculum sp. PtaB.Bin104]
MLDIYDGIREDLLVVEQELKQVLETHNPLPETSTSLLNAGGKRLRPALSLLGAKFGHFDIKEITPLAVALELIHMATLIHDDVVDDSKIRRGAPTVKARWGNGISAHIGMFIFAKAMELISKYEAIPLISNVIANVSLKMCEGEIQQISASFDSGQGVKDYFFRVKRKTALLISASVQLGAVACGAGGNIHLPLYRYGNCIGMAFQITDDILDLEADQRELGKPVGSDLRQGIITLPLIYAFAKSGQRNRLMQLARQLDKDEEEVQEAIELIRDCGAIDYSFKVARKYIEKAKQELTGLPDLPAKKTLCLIADFIDARKY